MSGAYRVEIAKQGRAGCQATHCKKEAIKIGKGELRQGVTVMIKEHTSMLWRHWGCVTPAVIKNWNETADGDMELVDGYDELPSEAQEKVLRCFQQGHVDDEDWKGDIECNRYDPNTPKQGMFLSKAQAKKLGKGDDAEDDEEKPAPKKTAAKKRGRKDADADEADADDAEIEAKPAKKPRGKAAAKAETNGDAPVKKATKSKAKKPSNGDVDDENDENDDAEPADEAPAPNKARGKKTKAADDEDAEPVEATKPAKKARGKATKAPPPPVDGAADDDDEEEPEEAPRKKAKATKKSKTDAEDAPAPAKAPARKGRAKKASSED